MNKLYITKKNVIEVRIDNDGNIALFNSKGVQRTNAPQLIRQHASVDNFMACCIDSPLSALQKETELGLNQPFRAQDLAKKRKEARLKKNNRGRIYREDFEALCSHPSPMPTFENISVILRYLNTIAPSMWPTTLPDFGIPYQCAQYLCAPALFATTLILDAPISVNGGQCSKFQHGATGKDFSDHTKVPHRQV